LKPKKATFFILVLFIGACSRPTRLPPPTTTTTPLPSTIVPSQTLTQTKTENNTPEATVLSTPLPTQTPAAVADWQLVWADEFDGSEIDRETWWFDSGPVNDTLHTFTDRLENTRIVNGVLQLIALEESYNGFDYTASLLSTKESMSWRYGRVEALIRLPSSNGFVPAFWMMPADDLYGWWPYSGEIDIMEHPTNQIEMIYGTVHTGAYSAFTGAAPRGGTITIPDAESEFHIYAIEWTEEKIDFFVDEQNYFTVENDQSGSGTWPFDQPFYVILSMGVGGGWVGRPDTTSVFPAVMEVDYVRVYQDLHDASISGPDFATAGKEPATYSAPAIDGLTYHWQVPAQAQIIAGQGTPRIEVAWGNSGGEIAVALGRANGNILLTYPVEVSENLLVNGGFEKGIKGWRIGSIGADFLLTREEVYTGSQAVRVKVKQANANPWDVQLSQGNLALAPGSAYKVGLWARADGANPTISLAVINSNDFSLYGNQTFTLTNAWAYYEMSFTVPVNVTASFNIDIGTVAGEYYFDEIILETE
jgi:beta-glucanase (GH16 family)